MHLICKTCGKGFYFDREIRNCRACVAKIDREKLLSKRQCPYCHQPIPRDKPLNTATCGQPECTKKHYKRTSQVRRSLKAEKVKSSTIKKRYCRYCGKQLTIWMFFCNNDCRRKFNNLTLRIDGEYIYD